MILEPFTPTIGLCVFPYVFSGTRHCYVPSAKSFAACVSARQVCSRRRRHRPARQVFFAAPLAAAAAQWPPVAPSPRPPAIAAPPEASVRAQTFLGASPSACETRRTPACRSDNALGTLRLILVALRLHLLIALVNKYKIYLYLILCSLFLFVMIYSVSKAHNNLACWLNSALGKPLRNEIFINLFIIWCAQILL